MLHLAQDLQALGWTVDVLAPHGETGTAAEEWMDGVRVRRFHYLWPQRSQTVCYHGGALGNLKAQPLNFLKLPMLVFCQWFNIVKLIRSEGYDAIHSHWILPQGFTGAIASRLFGIPHVVTVHGGDVFALQGKVLSAFKRFSLDRSDAITVNSSVTAAAVTRLVASHSKVSTVPMGVSVQAATKSNPRVKALRAELCPANGTLLAFVGRLVDEKGVEDYLRAIALLRNSIPAVKALIIGEGQERGRFECLARELSLQDITVFTGWVESEEVSTYLAAADVFLGPSRRGSDGWIEAQGLTFIEAMINRTPVVATRVGGIVDSVENEVTGLLVDERAPEQLAAAVKRLVDDPHLTARLVERARAKAVARFSRESSARSFSCLFESIVSDNDAGWSSQ
ncbi:MAG: hypothetical protein Cons2KO_10470 [Congregibacter sp.]